MILFEATKHLPPHASIEDVAGYIPTFLSLLDERKAAVQLNERYPFGGWQPFKGFKHVGDYVLTYPQDPPMPPLLIGKLRNETIVIYTSGWVAIFQEDGTFEINRLD